MDVYSVSGDWEILVRRLESGSHRLVVRGGMDDRRADVSFDMLVSNSRTRVSAERSCSPMSDCDALTDELSR